MDTYVHTWEHAESSTKPLKEGEKWGLRSVEDNSSHKEGRKIYKFTFFELLGLP